MGILKEYLSSNYFSSFGYCVALFHLPALLVFGVYTGYLRARELRTFRCHSSPDSRDDCLVQYDAQHNSPFPLYGFVLLCFLPGLAVCIAYSWCIVKTRVDEVEIALKRDPENPRRRPRVTTRRVFYFYSHHLLVRFVLGFLLIVLQNFVFFPNGFPTEFACVSPTVKLTVNSTEFNVTKGYVVATFIDCDNSVESDNATCAMGIWVVNVLFTILVFGELCYLSVRAIQSKEFTSDSEFCQKHFFSKSGTPVSVHEATLRMKRRVCEDTAILEPLIAQPGNESNRLLDDMFVDLVIYTRRAKHEFTDLLKRHEIFDIYLKPQHGSVPIKKLEQLFHPNKDTQDPRKILVVGRPGIGKSLLCTKLSRDWSNGDLLHDSNKSFEHLFLFQFRWFNTEITRNISLKNLLSLLFVEGSINSEVFQDILDNPEKVLLIFDGLDEFKCHKSCLEDERAIGGNSATEEMPFSALYGKLVKGKQLSGATVLTTCRPNVVQSLAGLKFDRTVEIMGFTPEKVQEYVNNFFAHDTETMNRIWGHISSSLELLSLCYIPVNSLIVCIYFEQLIKLNGQDFGSTLPTTSTEICDKVLRLFIMKCHPEFKGKWLTMGPRVVFPYSIEKMLQQVGSLAITGIQEKRHRFNSSEVQGMENCGLFNHLPDHQIGPFQYELQFCFIHVVFQELLAAREIAKMKPSDLSDFITSNASDPKWHLVIQFVAGLLHGQENEAVNTFVSLLCESLTTKPPVGSETKLKVLLMMKCLHEYNDESTLRKAGCELQKNSEFRNKIDLANCQVTAADCTAIVHFLRHLHEIAELDISGNNITEQGISLLCDALEDVNCQLTQLYLSYNNMTDQGVSHLCDGLKDVNCKLTQLDLSHNNMTDQGVSHLCDALKDVNSKLTQLDLSYNNMTDQGVSRLCDALKDVNCKLTQLDLSYYTMTDQGVSHLCNALKDANCKLTVLNLSSNNMTDQGLCNLCHALKDVSCKLTELDLSDTYITDQGVLHLSDALENVNCKLAVLNLSSTKMTDQGLFNLCHALKDVNCKLTELDLSDTYITDQGVSLLCKARKDDHSNCEFTYLDLKGHGVADQ